MALEKTFRELTSELGKVRETLLELRLTVVEDKPLKHEVALVDRLGDTIEDILGWIQEALTAAVTAEKAAGRPMDIDLARRELGTCHERFNRLWQQYFSEMVSYERTAELIKLGRERGGEWRRWSVAVHEAMERCRPSLQETNQSLLQCWQELAERLGMNSVMVQTTNIGQQIAAGEIGTRERVAEGVT